MQGYERTGSNEGFRSGILVGRLVGERKKTMCTYVLSVGGSR